MAKKSKSRRRTATPTKEPAPFSTHVLSRLRGGQDFDYDAFSRLLTRPIGIKRAAPAPPATDQAPGVGTPASAPQTLYMVVAGTDYTEPCFFDGDQFVRDTFSAGGVPIYDYDTAMELITRSNKFRLTQQQAVAGYRAVPVFEMTVYND